MAKNNRKETTEFLSRLLEHRIGGRGNYYAKEVSIDYGSVNVRRIDYMSFVPAGVCYLSDIEKGHFVCYEVKSCREDIYSGNGLNFLGEKNYIVTTMKCYKSILSDISDGTLAEHIRRCNPESSINYGIMVAVPKNSTKEEEFEDETKIDFDTRRWDLEII